MEDDDSFLSQAASSVVRTVMKPDASKAVEQTIGSFAGLIRRVAWRHRLQDSEIDELLQDLRIRLWRVAERGEKIEALPASYVYQAAVSAALDGIRRRRAQRHELSVPLEDNLESVATVTDARDPVAANDLVQQVGAAISSIHATRRPVVRMYLAGYPREEIADLLGWSEAKTRNLLYRGLADLRARLKEAGIEP